MRVHTNSTAPEQHKGMADERDPKPQLKWRKQQEKCNNENIKTSNRIRTAEKFCLLPIRVYSIWQRAKSENPTGNRLNQLISRLHAVCVCMHWHTAHIPRVWIGNRNGDRMYVAASNFMCARNIRLNSFMPTRKRMTECSYLAFCGSRIHMVTWRTANDVWMEVDFRPTHAESPQQP